MWNIGNILSLKPTNVEPTPLVCMLKISWGCACKIVSDAYYKCSIIYFTLPICYYYEGENNVCYVPAMLYNRRSSQ
jgi:hypothetical protein